MQPSPHNARAVVGLIGHLGRGVQRVATDAVLGSVAGLPRKAADLDIATLSKVLGSPVTSVEVLGSDAGTSSRARLKVTGRGVPDTVFVKLPAQTAATRLMGELGRLGHTEVRFYTELSDQLSGVPRCHGSAFDPLTGRYLLVLEDLPADDCEFPDTLHPLSPDQASLVVELLATLHAKFWERLPRGRWLYTP